MQDLRFGARSLARRPGFTLIAVLTLAIGIGANTAIYSVVDATLLRTLPFERPDRIMKVSLTLSGHHGMPPDDSFVWSFPKYQTFRQAQKVFEDTALYRGMQFNLTGAGEAERLTGEQSGAGYFPILGVKAALGRMFLREEDSTPATHFVAVLGHGLWQRRFGADPGVVGRGIRLDGRTYTVVGVAPAGFNGLSGVAELWVPVMASDPEELKQRWSHSHEMIARLKPGVTPEQARNAVVLLGKEVDRAHPAPFGNDQWGAKARMLDETRIDASLRKSVLVVFAAVGFVLLIACVNIANLLLARGGTRTREMAIRQAVGAGRWRLFRQLLTESVLLASLGAAAGVGIAWGGVKLLSSVNPATAGVLGRRVGGLTLIGLTSIGIDARALAFTFGLALITGVLFGLAPAIAGSRRQVSEALKGGAADRGSTTHFAAGKSVLVVTEIALAIVLLAGAGLMIRSFGRLLATRTGVDSENVLTARITQQFNPQGSPALFVGSGAAPGRAARGDVCGHEQLPRAGGRVQRHDHLVPRPRTGPERYGAADRCTLRITRLFQDDADPADRRAPVHVRRPHRRAEGGARQPNRGPQVLGWREPVGKARRRGPGRVRRPCRGRRCGGRRPVRADGRATKARRLHLHTAIAALEHYAVRARDRIAHGVYPGAAARVGRDRQGSAGL